MDKYAGLCENGGPHYRGKEKEDLSILDDAASCRLADHSFYRLYFYLCLFVVYAETAEKLATDIIQMMQPTQMVSWFFAGFPLVLLIVYVLRGKTVLKKRSQFFTPLLWMALLSGLKFVIPESPFSNAIDTFCMNAGLIIWFVYLIFYCVK